MSALRLAPWATIAAAAATVAACGSGDHTRHCVPATNGADCVQGGVSGQCVTTCDGAENYCAYPAPADCPETGLKFGVLAGDVATQCVPMCMANPDGGVADAAVDASGPDAGPLSQEILLVAYNKLYVYSADNLNLINIVPFPAGTHNVEGAAFTGGNLWLFASDQLTKLDGPDFTLAAGYPRAFTANQCSPLKSVMGPEGWTCVNGTSVERWVGEPLTYSKGRNLGATGISVIDGIARSDKAILVSHDETGLTVLDAQTFNQVPGSPILIAKPITMRSDDATHSIVITSWVENSTKLQLFDQGSLLLRKELDVSPSLVWTSLVDPDRGRVVVNLNLGFLAAYSIDDLAPVVTPVSETESMFFDLVYDASRGRIYGIADQFIQKAPWQLVVVDAETLENVQNSPVDVPNDDKIHGLFVR